MTKRRATFGKLQRERDKQAKAVAKRERRAARVADEDEETPDSPAASAEEPMQAELLGALAALQEAYDDGRLGLVEYEARRDDLRARIKVE
ncbi:MAG: hypothetical protein ACRD0U_00155 [Acidimicrobiales bacterium]